MGSAALPPGAFLKPPVLNMRTTDTAVTAGGDIPGWVSGTIASLAASATVTIVFDLGPYWDQYNSVQMAVNPVGPSSGLTAVQCFSSRTTTPSAVERLNMGQAVNFNTSSATATVAAGVQSGMFRASARYFCVQATNNDGTNALGASSSVAISVWPT